MFHKATAKQQTLNILLYGQSKSGKTLTSLLFAEGLAAQTGKRIAYVDTEYDTGGTDFYTMQIPERRIHPEPFDFDRLETRSLSKVIQACRALDPKEYGVVVVDSITHLWESAKDAYNGDEERIPMAAWSKIKAPFKTDFLKWMIASPFHFICCSRQRDQYEGFEKVGVGPKSENETEYEFPIVIRMLAQKDPKDTTNIVNMAFCEGDRIGVLSGRRFPRPTFQVIEPLLPLLGDVAQVPEDDDERQAADAEYLREKANEKERKAQELYQEFEDKILAASDTDALAVVAGEIKKKKTALGDRREQLLHLYTRKIETLTQCK